jgi:hypothetical protein
MSLAKLQVFASHASFISADLQSLYTFRRSCSRSCEASNIRFSPPRPHLSQATWFRFSIPVISKTFCLLDGSRIQKAPTGQFVYVSHLPGLNRGPHPYHGCALPTELRWLVSVILQFGFTNLRRIPNNSLKSKRFCTRIVRSPS